MPYDTLGHSGQGDEQPPDDFGWPDEPLDDDGPPPPADLTSRRRARASASDEVLPGPGQPLKVARILAAEKTLDGQVTIRWWRGRLLQHNGAHWQEMPEKAARRWIYERVEHALWERVVRGEEVLMPWDPTPSKVSDVLDAFSSTNTLDDHTESGTWLPSGRPLEGVVGTPSGMFHLGKRELQASTPRWWNTWSLPYTPDPAAPTPAAWLAFLDSVWPDDPDTIAMVQEWLGYLISGSTRLHKAMLLVGPKRSGKGTILRTAAQLVGTANVTSPTLQDMTLPFGLQDAIGKTLIAVGDARLAGGSGGIIERILKITGEDNVTVNRKFGEAWIGRLPGRIMIASNEVPDFRDSAGAIGSRFLVARMARSFYDNEDVGLEAKLDAELPGIFAWALDGLDRLTRTGRFTLSAASKMEQDAMQEGESPVGQFVEDMCKVGPDFTASKDDLYAAWNIWRTRGGYGALNINNFSKALRAAYPAITPGRVRSALGNDRVRIFTGLELTDAGRRLTDPDSEAA